MSRKFLLFAFVLLSFQLFAQKSYELSLVSGKYQIEANASILKWNDPIWAQTTFANHRYILVQFFNIPNESKQRTLEQSGIQLLSYLPQHSYVAKLSLSVSESELPAFDIRAVVPMQPAWKMATNLQKMALVPSHAREGDEVVKANVKVMEGENRNELATALKNMGVVLLEQMPDNQTLVVKTIFTQIEKIASIPLVEWIEPINPETVPKNLTGVTNHRAGVLQSTLSGQRGLSGQGVVVGIGDGGYVRPHFDFDNGRLRNLNINTTASYGDHGDHVAGTVGGAGVLNPAYKGMAPKCILITDQSSQIVYNAPSYIATQGMVLTNNSYGFGIACPATGGYSTYIGVSNTIDNQLRTFPKLLHCFAASNDGSVSPCGDYTGGFGTISLGFGTAKNALVVGAVSEADALAGFSSRGPTQDGRVKPEICGVGTSVLSTIPNNTYGSKQGTSMSTPGVTGTLALLYERYKQSHNGQNPDAALIKAVACNTADDIGNPQVDYRHGYGRINGLRAVQSLENNTYYSNNISQGNTQDVILTMPAGLAQVRVMLYWPDRQANSGASPCLVNNLNLEVIDPLAVTYNPWILDPTPANNNVNAVRGVDNLNNIEQVTITNPAAGNYTIRVTAPVVPFGPQNYYVVYEYLSPSITLAYPMGGEILSTGSSNAIRWDAFGLSGGSLILEYSTNNGGNWVTLSNSLNISTLRFAWTPGAGFSPTNTALIRVRHSTSSLADVSDSTFTLCGMPSVTVNNCDRQGFLNWTAITGASGYEIFHFPDGKPEVLTTTTSSPFIVTGLINGVEYFYAVRPVFSPTFKGERSGAVKVIPTTGSACPIANDVGIYNVLPASGRQFTSSQLSVSQAIQASIKNYGNNAQSGVDIPYFYQINNGAITGAIFNGILNSNTTSANQTFGGTADLSATGNYTLKVWTALPGDGYSLNDTAVVQLKHLPNPAINLPITENFSGLQAQELRENTIGIEGSTRFDFSAGSANSRLRVHDLVGLNLTGNKTITLDRAIQSTGTTFNHLVYTLNLSNHSAANALLLNFDYMHHGETASNTNDKVWARGTDAQAWVQVYDLFANQGASGSMRQVRNLNLKPLLGAQTIGSSFQIRFGQEGVDAATNITMKGGYTFHSFQLIDPGTDLEVTGVTSPNGNCLSTTSQTLTVNVKNNSLSDLTNVPIRYSINGAAPVSGAVPTLNAGATVSYSFAPNISLAGASIFQIRVWVEWNGPTPVADGYMDNDTATISVATAIASFPFLHHFDVNDGAFAVSGTNSSWSWGALSPFNTVINHATSGTKVWATNLSGSYNNSENSQIASPCFNLSGSFSSPGNLPVLSFSFSGITEAGYDFVWVEHSTDGVTWTKLGVFNGANSTNWYNRTENNTWHSDFSNWKVASYVVPSGALSTTTRFRIRLTSDGSVVSEGLAIDDFHIHSNNQIHNSVGDLTNRTVASTGSGNWLFFNNASSHRVAGIRDVSNMGTVSLDVRQTTGNARMFNSNMYMNRNFKITPASAPNQPVQVRLFFLESELNSLIANDGGVQSFINVKVNKYSGLSENLTPNDNALSPINFTYFESPVLVPYYNGYYAEFTTNGFSEFYLSGNELMPDAPLPLVKGSFQALALKKQAKLNWSLMPLHKIQSFTLERSFNGQDFHTVSTLAARQDLLDYEYFDDRKENIAYYRLQFVNESGESEKSAIRRVSWLDNVTVEVFPNPAHDQVFIQSNAGLDQVILINAVGQHILLNSQSTEGYKKEFQLPNLPTGIYTLKIQAENNWYHRRLTIK